ncbi:hypothetical protein [Streptosporangium carneum]|uniref:Uncharacterized protein n=1 Tax=Streptosporangium carneum TaxID=47481 RepID=A0A9W6MAH9_9ACTN|nr:hypothetical protein [Streptosporangium carneum]GLK07061.1 hypothetical protein GCM10017600_04660 [Streptosporangium carneum]
MDSQDSPLRRAVRLCLAGTHADEVAAGALHVMECLEDDDWETALILLEDLGDARPQLPEFWSLLADAARLLWLRDDAAWYEWRRGQARNGALRAELCLMRAEEGGRAVPIPPGGSLRPMWDIGHRTPEGDPLLGVAFLWVEGRDPLEPGECAPVRLIPLTPGNWRHLRPDDVITMHELRPPVATARIIEVMPPAAGVSQGRERLSGTRTTTSAATWAHDGSCSHPSSTGQDRVPNPRAWLGRS